MIVMIAVLVYLVGGCVYQRTVMHQRGWRQLPNYAMWAGIYRFVAVSLYYSEGLRVPEQMLTLYRILLLSLHRHAHASYPPAEVIAVSRSVKIADETVADGETKMRTG